MINVKSDGIFEFLKKLDDASVHYVSWKNNHELSKALTGESDIDIFVPFDFRADFIMMCTEDGWLSVQNPVAKYPWVNHLYKPDGKFKIQHIHVYFKVVTGESWLKEYILPLDSWLIENRVRSVKFDVWVLSDKAQAYLFAIRHLLKCGSLSSRFLYSREFDSYRDEWLQCDQNVNAVKGEMPIALESFLIGSKLYSGSFSLPQLSTALKFRVSASPFLRVAWWSLPARRFMSFFHRVTNKLYYGRKKILPNGGMLIAISGVDGAGKSTMLAEATDFFTSFLTVDRYHLGRPQEPVVEMFRRLFARESIPTAKVKGLETNSSSSVSIRKAISVAILAILRLRLARRAARRAAMGHLVLVDRWPTDMVGKMDGPRIHSCVKSGVLVDLCRRIEQWAYARMPRADICFYFEIPLEVAIDRNRNRIKDDKETDDEIRARFEGNRDIQLLARKTVCFNNAGELVVKREEFLWQLWAEILKH
jgi:thymidylate kinase